MSRRQLYAVPIPKTTERRVASSLIRGLLTPGGPVSLSGSIDAISTSTASLSVTKPIIGQIDLVSTLTALSSSVKPLLGTTDLVSAVDGALSVQGLPVPIMLKAVVQKTIDRRTKRSLVLSGLVPRSADQALAAAVDLVLSATAILSVQSSVVPTILRAPKQVSLGRLPFKSSSLLGVLSVVTTAHALSGNAALVSAVSGMLSGSKPLSGSIDAITTLQGVLSGAKRPAGTIDAALTVNGALTLQGQVVLAGSIDAAIALNAALNATKTIAGITTAALSTVGALSVQRPLVASVDLISALTAICGLTRGCQGAIVCTTNVDGAMRVAWALAGSTNPVLTITSALSIQGLVGEPTTILIVDHRGHVFDATDRVLTFDATER